MTHTEFNLADIFECVADEVPLREALSCGTNRCTFAELDRRANRLAHGLRQIGVRRDEHVGIFAFNSIEFLEAMLACYKIRAVPLNINFRYVGEELAYLLENGDVTTLVFDRALRLTSSRFPAGPPSWSPSWCAKTQAGRTCHRVRLHRVRGARRSRIT